MRAGIEDICAMLGLGAACDPPELVTGGSSAGRWRVRTTRGRWLVKTTPAPAAWQLREMRVAGRLERAAYEAGVPMPTPAQHTGTGTGTGTAGTKSNGVEAAGYWVRLGENGGYARASAWVDGRPSGEHVSASLAAWLGRTVAAIERLDLPDDPAAEAAYPLHAVPEWREWLDQAAGAGVLDSLDSWSRLIR